MPLLFVIDVGHGNCAVIKDGDRIIIIDTGRGSNLLEFLLKHQYNNIDFILLSHADQDHIAGLFALLYDDKIHISRIYINSDSSKESKVWDDLTYSLQERCDRNELDFYIGITPTIERDLNTGELHFQLIAPSQYLVAKGPGSDHRQFGKITSNSISAVLRLNYNNKNLVLLPGDLDWVGLMDILSKEKEINAFLTVYPHHGGRPGGGDLQEFAHTFCSAVRPDNIVFSVKSGSNDFPNILTISEIVQNFPQCKLFSTGHSNHLEQCKTDMQIATIQNGVGSLKIDLSDHNLQIEILE